MTENKPSRVCVTGAAGYIGSLLVKKLLEKGHSVHATLRNLGDESKVSLLKSLPNSDSNLVLFQADIYNPTQFQTAIHGCQFVFHVATPLLHNTSHTSQYKNTSDAAVAGVKQIANSCIQSQTVKRLIYTASVVSCTSHNFPEHEDESVLYMKPTIDESCWTPLDVSFKHATNMSQDYTKSKTLAEKEVLSYNNIEVEEYGKLEVVSIPCGLVGGKTLLPYLPTSVEVLLSPFIGSQSIHINSLMYLQEVIGSIPLVHVEDVCEAHIFCMEQQSIRGRFLCAVSNPTLKDIALYYHQNYPQFEISKELMEGPDLGSLFDLMKLTKMGFKYKYDMKKILDESVGCGRRIGN